VVHEKYLLPRLSPPQVQRAADSKLNTIILIIAGLPMISVSRQLTWNPVDLHPSMGPNDVKSRLLDLGALLAPTVQSDARTASRLSTAAAVVEARMDYSELKLVHRRVAVDLPGQQQGGGEVRLVDGVRVELRLQAQRAVLQGTGTGRRSMVQCARTRRRRATDGSASSGRHLPTALTWSCGASLESRLSQLPQYSCTPGLVVETVILRPDAGSSSTAMRDGTGEEAVAAAPAAADAADEAAPPPVAAAGSLRQKQ